MCRQNRSSRHARRGEVFQGPRCGTSSQPHRPLSPVNRAITHGQELLVARHARTAVLGARLLLGDPLGKQRRSGASERMDEFVKAAVMPIWEPVGEVSSGVSHNREAAA